MSLSIETQNGKRITVEADYALIGRDSTCQIALPDETRLQPLHAKIRKVADRWMIEAQGDWQIQVGTGLPGRMSWIKPGDTIRLTESGPEITFGEVQTASNSPEERVSQRSQPYALVAEPPKKQASEKPRPAESTPTTSPDLPTKVEEWFYARDGKKCGPLSATQLEQLAEGGTLRPEDLVWKAGMAERKVAGSVKGLFPAQASAAPLPVSPVLSEPVASAQNEDSLSFVDKVKGRLGKAINPRGADKLTAAKLFLMKHRLWFAIGTGVMACIILVLILLPGTLLGGKKSYTQAVLDLDPKILKERKIKLPSGAKPLHPPGSVLDLVQSLDLLNRDSQATCKCFTKAFEDVSPLIADKHAPAHEFVAIWHPSYGTLLPSETWNQIYGKPQNVETHDETGRAGASWDYWSIRCTDETVHVRGRFTKKTLLSFNQKEGKVSVERIFFTTHRDQICPKAKSMDSKGIFFSYK